MEGVTQYCLPTIRERLGLPAAPTSAAAAPPSTAADSPDEDAPLSRRKQLRSGASEAAAEAEAADLPPLWAVGEKIEVRSLIPLHQPRPHSPASPPQWLQLHQPCITS